jgi:DNA-binding response OmpR family regulator
MKKLALVVDDDKLSRDLIRRVLEKSDFQVLDAENGKQALEVFQRETNIPLVITDLSMPVMSGEELIDHLIGLAQPPIIIIHSSVTDIKEIIPILHKGVIDYIAKPLVPDELNLRINKSIESAKIKHIKDEMEREKNERNQAQLDWNRWKFETMRKDDEKSDDSMLEGLRHSFSQGTGFGSLIPTIQLIQRKAKPLEDGITFSVPSALIDLLISNMESGKRMIDTLEIFDDIIKAKFIPSTISLMNIHKFIEDILKEYTPYSDSKFLSYDLFKTKPKYEDIFFHGEINYLKMMIQELIINAIKFSEPKTKVYIICEMDGHKCKVSFLNEPLINSDYKFGIPKECSSMVFEPMVRLTKLVHEFLPTMDYGLGLTLVDKIIRRHSGSAEAYNIASHLDTSKILTNVSFTLPIAKH